MSHAATPHKHTSHYTSPVLGVYSDPFLFSKAGAVAAYTPYTFAMRGLLVLYLFDGGWEMVWMFLGKIVGRGGWRGVGFGFYI